MKSNTLLLAPLALLATAQASLAAPSWSPATAGELLAIAESAGDEGLDPSDYDLAVLRNALASQDDRVLQTAASATFLHLATDFTQGHVRNRAGLSWYVQGPTVDAATGQALLETALSGRGIGPTLRGLLPQHRQYRLLKAALATTPARDKAGAQRLRANLERWRWMPRELGRRYLLVNVPAFTVSLVEDNKVVARRRVIVGKSATPTPQFSATVTGMILNPWWDIPSSIVRESIGRLVAKRPAEARQKGYVVQNGRYRQRPGAGNALGQIKLVMPNPYNVYLHDTPNKALFDAEVRAFSHGCIRTDDPFGLAATLLAGTGGWDRARIDGVVAGGTTTQVVLGEAVPVYIGYFTIAAEDSGDLATFPDIYGRDPAIVAPLIDLENAAAP